MKENFDKVLKFPFLADESTIDIDRLTDRMKELTGEVGSYKKDILRLIAARRDLLGSPEILKQEEKTIEELLAIKNELDFEFRKRFRLKPDIPDSMGIDYNHIINFKSGK